MFSFRTFSFVLLAFSLSLSSCKHHSNGERDSILLFLLTRVWIPSPGTTFQIQFSDTLDESVDAQVFDIDSDLTDSDPTVIQRLHAAGKKVICYIDVGSYENYRSDASKFPPEILGNVYSGYPDEQWLDIRRIDLLNPIFSARFDKAKAKGCDAIDPDNLDGYQNDTGFPLSADDQIRFNRWVSDLAHFRGMSVGLKNDPDQIPYLIRNFDWAITESCYDGGWCNLEEAFPNKGSAVFQIEYVENGTTKNDFCSQSISLRLSGFLKNQSLDAYRDPCP
ncbi:endo alpha-1,4 polygalactosaminidase [Leptospira andrefontaineae]|uniref:Endo alpha-1,4 polygalactosaminidase n=1 Tax=Leptospira andrefontaineae TaxID=2484976 RepID=A0A4R9H3R7_9LEPT|nr:endo alpha-1,4 polygalactosaminidase [Leptospira andrefontaineae]TGK39539.1 endo alpha-1,4 polygalactosaminidase [Leptospira andrefontaineae]